MDILWGPLGPSELKWSKILMFAAFTSSSLCLTSSGCFVSKCPINFDGLIDSLLKRAEQIKQRGREASFSDMMKPNPKYSAWYFCFLGTDDRVEVYFGSVEDAEPDFSPSSFSLSRFLFKNLSICCTQNLFINQIYISNSTENNFLLATSIPYLACNIKVHWKYLLVAGFVAESVTQATG